MQMVAWSVINNELQFLKDTIDYHLSWLDKIYFLDTGSTDGGLEYLLDRQNNRIIVETYHTRYVPRYDQDWLLISDPFPEIEVRNYALKQLEKLQPDWLIQIDGDEIFLSNTRSIIEESSAYSVIGHSTINPVAKLSDHPKERRGGKILWDPHARIWKPNKGYKYIGNSAFPGKQCHCIPVNAQNKHLYHLSTTKFTDEIIHFHLHWMYGTKVEQFYQAKGIDKKQIPNDQTENQYLKLMPEIFIQRRQEWQVS